MNDPVTVKDPRPGFQKLQEDPVSLVRRLFNKKATEKAADILTKDARGDEAALRTALRDLRTDKDFANPKQFYEAHPAKGAAIDPTTKAPNAQLANISEFADKKADAILDKLMVNGKLTLNGKPVEENEQKKIVGKIAEEVAEKVATTLDRGNDRDTQKADLIKILTPSIAKHLEGRLNPSAGGGSTDAQTQVQTDLDRQVSDLIAGKGMVTKKDAFEVASKLEEKGALDTDSPEIRLAKRTAVAEAVARAWTPESDGTLTAADVLENLQQSRAILDALQKPNQTPDEMYQALGNIVYNGKATPEQVAKIRADHEAMPAPYRTDGEFAAELAKLQKEAAEIPAKPEPETSEVQIAKAVEKAVAEYKGEANTPEAAFEIARSALEQVTKGLDITNIPEGVLGGVVSELAKKAGEASALSGEEITALDGKLSTYTDRYIGMLELIRDKDLEGIKANVFGESKADPTAYMSWVKQQIESGSFEPLARQLLKKQDAVEAALAEETKATKKDPEVEKMTAADFQKFLEDNVIDRMGEMARFSLEKKFPGADDVLDKLYGWYVKQTNPTRYENLPEKYAAPEFTEEQLAEQKKLVVQYLKDLGREVVGEKPATPAADEPGTTPAAPTERDQRNKALEGELQGLAKAAGIDSATFTLPLISLFGEVKDRGYTAAFHGKTDKGLEFEFSHPDYAEPQIVIIKNGASLAADLESFLSFLNQDPEN